MIILHGNTKIYEYYFFDVDYLSYRLPCQFVAARTCHIGLCEPEMIMDIEDKGKINQMI